METNLNRVFLSIEEMQKLTSYGLDTSDARYCYVKKNTEAYDLRSYAIKSLSGQGK